MRSTITGSNFNRFVSILVLNNHWFTSYGLSLRLLALSVLSSVTLKVTLPDENRNLLSLRTRRKIVSMRLTKPDETGKLSSM